MSTPEAPTTAEEAILRAKAIAARLARGGAPGDAAPAAASSTPAPGDASGGVDAATAAAAAAAIASALGEAHSNSSAGPKRKRWATDESSGSAPLPGLVSDSSEFNKRPKSEHPSQQQQQQQVSKRLWVDTSNNPKFNYVGFIIGPGGTKQKELIAKAGGPSKIKISIRGRGSNASQPPVPGAPEEPLHIMLEGDPDAVELGEKLVTELLREAQEAAAKALASQPATDGSGGSSAADEKNRQLAEAIAARAADAVAAAMGGAAAPSHNSPPASSSSPSDAATAAAAPSPASSALTASHSSSSSSYRPAPVAQLIGQAFAPAPAPSSSSSAGIYGPAGAAAGASTPAEMIEEQIGVPNGVVGYIIGKGGESINNMQRRSGCRVQIQKESEMPPGSTQRVITLTASTRESIATCRGIIEQMVQERLRMNAQPSSASVGVSHSSTGPGANAAQQAAQLQRALAEGQVLVQVQVPDADVGLIIGRGGCNIRSIQDRSGANVQIPQVADANNPTVRTVSVTHPTAEGANFAKQMIEEILNTKLQHKFQQHSQPQAAVSAGMSGGGVQQSMNPGDVTIQVQIPDKDVGMVIGRSGCVIKEMQTRTRTRIQIPSHPTPGQPNRIATISGSQEGCNQVKQMIERIIVEQSSQSVMTGSTVSNNSYSQYGQQQGSYGQYPQVTYGQQYGQQYQAYGQQQYGSYGAQQTAAPTYGQAAQQTSTNGQQKTDYSAEWAAYYAAQAAAQQGGTGSVTPAPAAPSASPAPATAATPGTGSAGGSSATSGNTQQSQQPAADAYYEQFWRYAAYYGDEAARKYYGAWSPPPGTPNPYASSGASGGQGQQQQQQQQPQSSEGAKDSSVRSVSNLPAWMTKS